MSYLKDREIWLSNVPTSNPPAGYVWVFIQNGVFVVRDSNGLDKIMATTTGTVTNATSASYVEYSNVASKPALISGSSQVSYTGLSNIPVGIVSGSSQVTYSGLTGVPAGIVSGSAQVASFGIFATTGSNGFNGSQSITGSLTVTGQVVAQTLNVQQVTSSVVYSSGSNVFGNSLGNTQQFTGSVSMTGSLTVNGVMSLNNDGTYGSAYKTLGFTGNTNGSHRIFAGTSDDMFFAAATGRGLDFRVSGSANSSLYIASTGAATFSSSVSANGVMSLGNDGTFGSTYKTLGLTGNTTGTHRIFAGTADDMYFAAATGRGFEFRANGGGVGNLNINSNGNVGIGTPTPSTFLHVFGSNTSARGQLSIQSNNASNAARATWYYDTTLQGNIGTTSGDFYVEAINNLQLLAGGNISMGSTSVTSFSTPNGGQLIAIPNAVIVSGVIAFGSPYTQNIQIDIVYGNWGSNSVIGVVDMIITLREYAHTSGTAFGKIFATNTSQGSTFTSFNTTDVTASQCSITATSGGSYTLRITIDPSNVTDRGSFYLVIPSGGGTGSEVSSITVSYV